mmetsp:Transcript_22143/g.67991  ORF Transcript_22143/g.67991 Transcript_22143/m.67991 type:complete len:713 (-) Transcript_22143:34-2172(-)
MAQRTFWRPGAAGAALERGSGADAAAVPNNPRGHLPIAQQRRSLPIFQARHGLLYALDWHRVVVLVGETGSGKTTQLPQYLDGAGWTRGGRCIAITQPRRIAAATCAQRVAEEMGVALGAQVGYNVRFERVASDDTRVLFCTDGALVREALRDPLLTRYSVVVLDEAHERSLHTDVLLGVLKKIMRVRRHLRLVISSATIDAEKFAAFFRTNMGEPPEIEVPGNRGRPPQRARLANSTIVAVSGRTHPVDILHSEQPVAEYVRAAVDTVAMIHRQEPPGDVLVFLPGGPEVDAAVEMARDLSGLDDRAGVVVQPLYASLPRQAQIAAFRPPPRGKRKVVFATNIAETSVTITGIRYVVDCGFSRMPFYDAESDLQVLCTTAISRASAVQRAGRAGRVTPGKCFRLYSETAFKGMRSTTPPEIQRRDVSWLVLQLKALAIDDVLHFDFISPPTPEALMRALESLVALRAIDDDGRLTALGETMSEFPLEPRLSKALLSAEAFEVEEQMLTAAAMLSVQRPWVRPRGRSAQAKEDRFNAMAALAAESGDVATYVSVFNEWENAAGESEEFCRDNFVSGQVLQRAAQLRKALERYLSRHRLKDEEVKRDWDGRVRAGVERGTMHSAERFIRCFIAGFFNNVATLEPDGRYKVVRGGALVQLHPDAVFANFGAPPEFVAYADVEMREGATVVSEVNRIHPRWVLDAAPHFYSVRAP